MDNYQKKKLKYGILKTIERLPIAEFKNKKSGKYQDAHLYTATALCICCFIDAMGKYIYNGRADKDNFKGFIKDYMPDFYKSLINKANKEKISGEKYLDQFYENVRCGLVHEYFPKSKTFIISKNCKGVVFGNKGELKICLPQLIRSWKKGFNNAIKNI